MFEVTGHDLGRVFPGGFEKVGMITPSKDRFQDASIACDEGLAGGFDVMLGFRNRNKDL